MRLNTEQISFIKENLAKVNVIKDIYLFGSRVDDMAKGGDIDILILSDKYVEPKIIRRFKINFYKNFGWQKIDIVNFLVDEKHPFKNVALDKAVKL